MTGGGGAHDPDEAAARDELEARLRRERARRLDPAEAEQRLAASDERPLPADALERIVAERPPQPSRRRRWWALPLAALVLLCGVGWWMAGCG